MLKSNHSATPGLGWSGELAQPWDQGGRGRAARCAPCRTFHGDLMNISMKNVCRIIVSRKGKYSRTSSRASHGPTSTRTGSPCSNCTKRSKKISHCFVCENNFECDAVFALLMLVWVLVLMFLCWCEDLVLPLYCMMLRALATWLWQLSQHKLCILFPDQKSPFHLRQHWNRKILQGHSIQLLPYMSLASLTALSHPATPPSALGKDSLTILRELITFRQTSWQPHSKQHNYSAMKTIFEISL